MSRQKLIGKKSRHRLIELGRRALHCRGILEWKEASDAIREFPSCVIAILDDLDKKIREKECGTTVPVQENK